MGHAFVSYSSKDRDFVLNLAGDLKAAGCDLWLDRWNIVGRDPFWDEIQAGIEGCSHFIFVISPDSIDRHSGALTELLHAASLQPPPIIVPVMARETPYQKLPIVVSPGKYQIHDFTRQPYEDCVERVTRTLQTNALTTAPIERLLREQYEAPTRISGLPTLSKAQQAQSALSASQAPETLRTPVKRASRASCSASFMRLSVTIALTAVAAAFVFVFSQGQITRPASTDSTQGANPPIIAATSALDVKSGTGSATDFAGDAPGDVASETPDVTPTAERLPNTPAPGCSNAPAPRLVVGQRGRVTPGLDNLVNDRPARIASGAVEVVRMSAGTEFDVLDGPVCADGLIWWQILHSGYYGWTAEGEGGQYWLEPVE
ncbi:MAG: toll/interleukin-1 receptor domain-containing protein [Anaerolineae bacterium]|nr:toll/interleukin-1 receptor domain-containing protein [Anaerolineae bacterium]